MTDPWAAASAQATQSDAASDNLDGAYQPEADAESQLFSGGSGVSYPSLFNKTHPLGTIRTGVIVKVTDVHSRTYNDGKPGELKYWQEGADGPVTNRIDPVTGKPNRPVMDTHFELDTDYRITAAECSAIGRNTEFVSKDEGKRVFAAGGYDLKATKEALARDSKPLGLTKTADLIGKRITVKRAAQKPNPKGNPSWVLAVKFENA